MGLLHDLGHKVRSLKERAKSRSHHGVAPDHKSHHQQVDGTANAESGEPVKPEEVTDAFVKITSGEGHAHGVTAYTKADEVHEHKWFRSLIPGVERLANKEHIGNYVAMTRGPQPVKEFEAMPIYARLGMHILFHGRTQAHVLHMKKVEELFRKQSIHQGKIFDSPEGALEQIKKFVKEYNLGDSLDQLVKPNLEDYKTFNEFFSRAVKPEARPIDGQGDRRIIVSAADCRLTVFDSISKSREFWVKDHSFTVKTLLNDDGIAAQLGDEPSLAIFRLAPADYHRWHSPIDGTLKSVTSHPGMYYTVNPQAVNEDLNVFTANKRDVAVLSWPAADANQPDVPVVIVAVGALLVASITWLKGLGEPCDKGTPQGYFSYGGSTVIALFPKGTVKWDDDLTENSQGALETKVAAGNHIGVALQMTE